MDPRFSGIAEDLFNGIMDMADEPCDNMADKTDLQLALDMSLGDGGHSDADYTAFSDYLDTDAGWIAWLEFCLRRLDAHYDSGRPFQPGANFDPVAQNYKEW